MTCDSQFNFWIIILIYCPKIWDQLLISLVSVSIRVFQPWRRDTKVNIVQSGWSVDYFWTLKRHQSLGKVVSYFDSINITILFIVFKILLQWRCVINILIWFYWFLPINDLKYETEIVLQTKFSNLVEKVFFLKFYLNISQ